MDKSQREACQLAEKAGLVVLSITRSGGGHWRMNVRRPDGTTALFFTQSSGSDHRGSKNKFAEFRRFAAGITMPIARRG